MRFAIFFGALVIAKQINPDVPGWDTLGFLAFVLFIFDSIELIARLIKK